MQSRLTQQTNELRGVSVLVTRPAHQQQAFVNLLRQHNAAPVSLPCLAIRSLAEKAASELQALERGQVVIFTSVNAVQAAHVARPMPWTDKNYTIFAVGPSTAKELLDYGIQVTRQPMPPYNSEALLRLPQLQKESLRHNLQKVSIITGRGGRGYLAHQLSKRAVNVENIAVYERYKPEVRQNTLNSIFLMSDLDIVTITSNEALQNLFDLVGVHFRFQLLRLPLVVNSQRCAHLAKDLCFQSRVLIATEPGDHGQLDAIKLWNSS